VKKRPEIFAKDNDPDVKAVWRASKGIVKTNRMSDHFTAKGTLSLVRARYTPPWTPDGKSGPGRVPIFNAVRREMAKINPPFF